MTADHPDHAATCHSAPTRLRLTLTVRTGAQAPGAGEVALTRLEGEGGTIAIDDLSLRLGQPVALRFDDGETLRGTVRWTSDVRAGIAWDHALGAGAVRALRIRHMGFLGDSPNLDFTVFRSVA